MNMALVDMTMRVKHVPETRCRGLFHIFGSGKGCTGVLVDARCFADTIFEIKSGGVYSCRGSERGQATSDVTDVVAGHGLVI